MDDCSDFGFMYPAIAYTPQWLNAKWMADRPQKHVAFNGNRFIASFGRRAQKLNHTNYSKRRGRPNKLNSHFGLSFTFAQKRVASDTRQFHRCLAKR